MFFLPFLSVPRPAEGRLRRAAPLWTLVAALLLTACDRSGSQPMPVVIYASVDEPFARAVLDEFTRKTGIPVRLVPDSEAGKTTGLLRRIEREAARPRADVWWSGEVFGTIALGYAGLLAPYDSPAGGDISPEWRDPNGLWTGMAARARVVVFHTGRVGSEALPTTWPELTEPTWAARSTLANPLFGTTRGHWAVLFAEHGAERGREMLTSLRNARAVVADGNSHVVRLVAAGGADAGWTDTDDCWVGQARGDSIDLVYPTIGPDRPALWIPCTVALVRGGPNPAGAQRLVDFLVSETVEKRLYESDARHIPVRPALRKRLGYAGPHPAALDYARAAAELAAVDAAVRDILLR